VGFAPAARDKHDWLIALLEGVEDIPGTALAEGLTWEWESFPQYLDALEARRFILDLGAQVPHAALRTYVMGERGGDHTLHPSDREVDDMERLTGEALLAGALGFSTSRTLAHRSRNGSNIGTLEATARELRGIARALKRTDRGVIQLISDAYLSADPALIDTEISLIRELATVSERNLSFTVMQTDGTPERWRTLLEAAQGMVDAGLPVRAQVAPRPVGVLLSFASSFNPFCATPTFRDLSALTTQARLARLRELPIRRCILQEYLQATALGRAPAAAFGRIFRMDDPVDYEPSADRSIAAEAARCARDPVEHAYDVLLEAEGRRVLYWPIYNYAAGNLDAVHGMMSDPNALYGLSDAGAHCGLLCDGSFPTTTLALWSRGSRTGRSLPIEFLVSGYSRRNALHVGWLDRGVLAPGYLADLNVIDLGALGVSPPRLVPDLPAGGVRFLQEPHGYRWTLKRGTVTFQDGSPTGELPGRLQRGPQQRRH
jgi:N-acyl-D-aspartate/D-glutamate deacylase